MTAAACRVCAMNSLRGAHLPGDAAPPGIGHTCTHGCAFTPVLRCCYKRWHWSTPGRFLLFSVLEAVSLSDLIPQFQLGPSVKNDEDFSLRDRAEGGETGEGQWQHRMDGSRPPKIQAFPWDRENWASFTLERSRMRDTGGPKANCRSQLVKPEGTSHCSSNTIQAAYHGPWGSKWPRLHLLLQRQLTHSLPPRHH